MYSLVLFEIIFLLNVVKHFADKMIYTMKVMILCLELGNEEFD